MTNSNQNGLSNILLKHAEHVKLIIYEDIRRFIIMMNNALKIIGVSDILNRHLVTLQINSHC